MPTHNAPKHPCYACGTEIDSISDLQDSQLAPKPGDFSVCLKCGALLILDERLVGRKPTQEEKIAIMNDRDNAVQIKIIRQGITYLKLMRRSQVN